MRTIVVLIIWLPITIIGVLIHVLLIGQYLSRGLFRQWIAELFVLPEQLWDLLHG